MTTMDKRNVTEALRPLPQKIEMRLAELLEMGEFDKGEVAWCRAAYWGARDDWHKILVDCHDEALRRHAQAEKTLPGGAKVAHTVA